jgi:pimeloyl-ACP methyl ester carboxylesterase
LPHIRQNTHFVSGANWVLSPTRVAFPHRNLFLDRSENSSEERTMSTTLKQKVVEAAGSSRPTENARARLLSTLPLAERTLDLAGVQTAVLEGGDGPPVVLLHGPGEYAAKWVRVLPELTKTHRVIAPDMPGHGNSFVPGGTIEADRVLDWLGTLIEHACATPPTLVGQILGGAIAARFAGRAIGRLSRLVLVDTLGLAPFQPAPNFGRALADFHSGPDEKTHDGLWRYCAFDLERLREQMGESWDLIKAYNLDRARTTALHTTQQSLMEQFGMPAISPVELERIAVPTMLIWGRHDLATPLSVAEAASRRYGWPLRVIEGAADDPPMEQPRAFLTALDAAFENA